MLLSDQSLLQILALSKDATAIYDSVDLHIRFANDAMLKNWGKKRDILGMTLAQAVPELIGQPFLGILKSVWETGETYTATDTPADLLLDGHLKTYYFDFEYRAILDEDQRTIAILHTATDVTTRREAIISIAQNQQREEDLIAELTQSNSGFREANQKLQDSNNNINLLNLRLQESETDFRRLVEQAPVAILVFRGENLVIDIANSAMLEILDKTPDIIGRPILDAMPELRGEPAVDLLFDVFRSGRIEDGLEVPVRMKRGDEIETRYFNFSYRPLMDNGKIVGVMDLAVEVTAQVLAKQTLRANEQRLQSILDTMAEGLIIVNQQGLPTYANLMAQRIMGMDQNMLSSRRYDDAKWENQRVDGSQLPTQEHPMELVLSTGKAVYDQEIAIKLPSTEKKFVSINAAPLFGEQGEPMGGIATFTDVTQRRVVLQQKDDFISVASHELKTPITALKASIQLLDRMKNNVNQTMLVKLIDQSTRSLNKLSELVASLLDANRISQGRFPVNLRKFKIGEMLSLCARQMRSTTRQQIVLEGKMDLEINADEQLLEQVVINFLNNAIKYAPMGETISIDVQEINGDVKVCVKDQGPGVEPDKLPHVFERYYRADHSGLNFSGLGLGLFICAEIIQKHRGTIGVDNLPDQGANFWFRIPI